jgi:hypothetical protein
MTNVFLKHESAVQYISFEILLMLLLLIDASLCHTTLASRGSLLNLRPIKNFKQIFQATMVSLSRNVLSVSLTLLLASSKVQGFSSPTPTSQLEKATHDFRKFAAQGFLLGCLAIPQAAGAVAGGGLDYANLVISGQDFSNGNYKGKDFTQVCGKSCQCFLLYRLLCLTHLFTLTR